MTLMSQPIKRPAAGEDEEDLLRLQAEFMKKKEGGVKKDVVDVKEGKSGVSSAAPISRKRRIGKEPCTEDSDVYKTLDDKDSDLVSILTNICELDVGEKQITTPSATKRGFPCVKDYQISQESKMASGGKKKSLFAMQFDKTHNFVPKERRRVAEKAKARDETSAFLENVLPAERMAIEEQTNRILNKMTEEEKRQEAEKIFKNMDPKLVEFLKKRKREAQEKREAEKREAEKREAEKRALAAESEQTIASTDHVSGHVTTDGGGVVEAMDTEDSHTCSHDNDYLHPVQQRVMIGGEEVEIPVYVKPGHRPNMGVLEPEKLQWMSDIPKTKPVTAIEKQGDQEDIQVRFDFDGKIVPRGTDIHLDRGLHHHGEEPSEAGYTLDELFILSRSMVLRQRQIALETLVHITQRARHALYTKHVKQPMLQLLLDSGIVQLYRHALDTSDYEFALQGLAALLLSPTEIFMQDELYPCLSLYTLQPATHITKDMDHDAVLATDVLRLLVDSQLPQRFWYLVSKHKLTETLVKNSLGIVQHLAQHSLHVTSVFMNHQILLDKIFEIFLPTDLTHFLSCETEECFTSHPSHIAVKILRIMCSYSKKIAEDMLKRYSLDSVIKMYISLSHKDFKGDEMLKCQLEISRLWDVMLRWGLCSCVYTAVYPLLVRELAGGGQRSVKLTTSLLGALTSGLTVFPWQDVGSIYRPVLTNMLNWANRPPSGKELPPKDDIALITAVLKFLCSFIKLHHSKHYDVHLVEQVSDLVNKIIRPLVTGTMLDNALNHMVYCKSFPPKKCLQMPSLPTLELHQYHRPTLNNTDTLDLCALSPAGEELLLFYTCTQFIQQTSNFLSTAFNVNKQLSEVVVGFLEKCNKLVLNDLSRHRRYSQGKLVTDLPHIIFHAVTMLQLDYVSLAYKVVKKRPQASEGLEELLLRAGIRILSELRAGFEYHQFNLLSGLLFDSNVNKSCASLSHLFIKTFEDAVSRKTLMKSQKYWTNTVHSTERSLYLGKLVTESNVKSAWMFLADEVLTALPDSVLLEYLTFLEYLVFAEGMLSCVPTCVQLVHIMKIFMLSSQPFLLPKISQSLHRFLDHFSNLPFIDFKGSKLSGFPSFYDFFNSFCGSYEAEGFCDVVFAGFILLPTRCDYALTYRRLIWVQRIETLRLLRKTSIHVPKTLVAIETDADMMTIYVTALKNGISGIPKLIAMHHLVRFFVDERVKKEDKLLNLVARYFSLCSNEIKEEILKFDRVNEFNEVVFHEKIPANRRGQMKL